MTVDLLLPNTVLYGTCWCGAARQVWRITDDRNIEMGLCCSRHHEHGPDIPPEDK